MENIKIATEGKIETQANNKRGFMSGVETFMLMRKEK